MIGAILYMGSQLIHYSRTINMSCAEMGAIIISGIALIVALITLFKVIKQTELVRKQVFGEVYDHAQIRDLQFYLPEKQKHPVEGFRQKEDSEITIGNSISITVDEERELHIQWWMAESQTLRNFIVGFGGDFKNKPKIVRSIRAFAKKEFSALPREEYIDWHGNYHCEYGHARRLPKDECFVTALKVEGTQKGKYILTIEIFVAEAPHPFEGQLEVNCQ
jgi:hypothetical protein